MTIKFKGIVSPLATKNFSSGANLIHALAIEECFAL